MKLTIRVLKALIIAVIGFHILIILKVIPYSIAWGGSLENDEQMYVFEGVSILINAFIYLLLDFRQKNKHEKFTRIFLIIFFAIFLLNTVGNIFAKTQFERYFSILTLLFAILIGRILFYKRNKETDY
jgi:membrane protease YdiL (CAAX protease family)